MADIESHTGLIELLLLDHQKAKMMLGDFDGVPPANRSQAFCEITHALIGHEVAEEEVLYPAVRKHVDGGDELADERIAEQGEAERQLAELDKLDSQTDEFLALFAELRDAVLQHALEEEEKVFPRLAHVLDVDEQVHLGQRYERAKQAAPTHPHPHAPDTPPGNLVAGPVAAFVDRVRDVVHEAMHTTLTGDRRS